MCGIRQSATINEREFLLLTILIKNRETFLRSSSRPETQVQVILLARTYFSWSWSFSRTKDILQNKCGNFRGTWRIPYPRKHLETHSLIFIAKMLSFSETNKYGNYSPERTLFSALAYRDFSWKTLVFLYYCTCYVRVQQFTVPAELHSLVSRL